nr:uncharacterized protein LOC117442389 [Pseudochaenichthys georgianus]
MKATFQCRQAMTRDQQASSTVLDVFPRFLDIPGLVDQDFTMMFGEEISGKMLARWPTFFKPRILADCKNLHSNVHVDDLLSAQQNSNESGWDSDLSSILLLVHLLPPTSKGHKKSAKISSYQAVSHVVRYLKIGASVETFLSSLGPGQPFLLCVAQLQASGVAESTVQAMVGSMEELVNDIHRQARDAVLNCSSEVQGTDLDLIYAEIEQQEFTIRYL